MDELQADINCRPVVPLADCRVRRITAAEARPLVEKFEWTGKLNTAPVAIYGLLAGDGELLGVASFGQPNGTRSRDLCGPKWRSRVIALERGCCVPWAAPNAGTYLLARACKAVAELGYNIIIAYGDPVAGERGGIYAAASWLHLGAGPGRPGHRWQARFADGT